MKLNAAMVRCAVFIKNASPAHITQERKYVTLHGKTRNNVIARAQHSKRVQHGRYAHKNKRYTVVCQVLLFSMS